MALIAVHELLQPSTAAQHGPELQYVLLSCAQGHKAWVLCVAWSPDAAQIATGDMAGVLWLWDPATGKPHGSCKGEAPTVG